MNKEKMPSSGKKCFVFMIGGEDSDILFVGPIS
jgi:hypothetical protein